MKDSFKTCPLCYISELYPTAQTVCGHCGSRNLRPSTRADVRANLWAMEQRSTWSDEAREVYARAIRFTYL